MQDSHQQETTELYNQNAEKYKAGSKDFEFPEKMFDIFLSYIAKEDKILDIGCAYGRDISRLRKLGYKAFGLEVSESLIKLADTDVQKHIKHGEMTHVSSLYSQKSFSAIISSASIVHMDHEIGIKVLEDCYNILKDEGILFLSLKVHSERKIEYKESLSTPGVTKKYVYFGGNETEDILKNIGFEILKTHTWKPGSDAWKILIVQK